VPDALPGGGGVWGCFVALLMDLVRDPPLFFFVAAVAGIGWTVSAAELWVAAQRAMPGWARGRMNATVIMAAQGAMALGGILWGTIAAMAGVQSSLLVQAIAISAVIAFTRLLLNPLSLDFTITP